jgi:cyclopropane-fatty-acyl-phospholipid synthase
MSTLPKDRSLSKLVSQVTVLDTFCRKILFNKFKEIKYGQIKIEDRSGNNVITETFGDPAQSLKVVVVVYHSRFYSRTLLGGSIGNAESYIDLDWSTEHLTDLVRLFVLNRDILQGIDSGFGNLLKPIQKFFHGLRKNTIEGSRKNIRSHYDIGNDFFKLFLDESMMYSCGLFNLSNHSL